MGVKDLWTILSPVGEVLPLSALEGMTIAIDLSCWVCEAQAVTMGYIAKPHLRNLLFRTSTFLQIGILPVFVIEGTAPQLKWDTISARNQKVWQRGKVSASSKTGKRSNFNSILKECKELLDLLGLPWVQAEGEAEATCAALNYAKVVDGVVTQDNDIFLYGGQVVYRNLSANQNKATVDRFNMKQIKEKLHLSRDSMVVMAILLGCDYLPTGIPGVGKEKALKLLRTWQHCDAIQRIFSWTAEAKAEESSDLPSQKGKAKFHNGIESQIRQKAVAVPGFPFPKIINEYTQQRIVRLKDCDWRCPQMLKLVEWCVRKLDWVQDYAFEKIVPLVARWQVSNIIPATPANISTHQLQIQPLQIKKKCVNKGTSSYVVEWKVCPALASCVPSSSHTFTTKEPNVKVQSALSHLLQEFEALHLKEKGKSKAKGKKVSSKDKPAIAKSSVTKKDLGKIDAYLTVNSTQNKIHSNLMSKTSSSSEKDLTEEWKVCDASLMQQNLSWDATDDADISLIVDRILGIDIGVCKVRECDEWQNSARSLSQRASAGSEYSTHSKSRNKDDKENVDNKTLMNTVGKFTKLGTNDSLIYLSSDDESERKPLSLKDVNRINTQELNTKEMKYPDAVFSPRAKEHSKLIFDEEGMDKTYRVCDKENASRVCNIQHKSRMQTEYGKEALPFRKGLLEKLHDTKLSCESIVDITAYCRNDTDSLVTATATCNRNDSESIATTINICSARLRMKTSSEIKVNKGDICQSSDKEAAAAPPDTIAELEVDLKDREVPQFNSLCSFKQTVIREAEDNIQHLQDDFCSTLEDTTLPLLDDLNCRADHTSPPQDHLCCENSSSSLPKINSTSLPPERDLSSRTCDGMMPLHDHVCERERTALSSQCAESIEYNHLQVSRDLFDDSDNGEMSKDMSLFNLCTSIGFEDEAVEGTVAPVVSTCPVGSSQAGSLVSLRNLDDEYSSYKAEMKCTSSSRSVPYSPLVRYECCFPNHEGNVASTPKDRLKIDVPNFDILRDCSFLHPRQSTRPDIPHAEVGVGESRISENQDPHVSCSERNVRLNDTFSPVEVSQTLAQRLKSRFHDKTFSKLIDKLQ